MALCSCGNRGCRVASIWREILETNDNLMLLIAEQKHFSASLQHLHQVANSRNCKFTEWERDQESYREQMLATLPQARGRIERFVNIASMRREDTKWITAEMETIKQRLQTITSATMAHEQLIIDLQLKVVQNTGNELCRPSVVEIIQFRRSYLNERLDRVQRAIEENDQELEVSRRIYVNENTRIRKASATAISAHILGMNSNETRWAMHAGLNVFEPQSRGRAEAALVQISLTQQFELKKDQYQNHLTYDQAFWRHRRQWPNLETIQILKLQQEKWLYLEEMVSDMTKQWDTTMPSIGLLA